MWEGEKVRLSVRKLLSLPWEVEELVLYAKVVISSLADTSFLIFSENV